MLPRAPSPRPTLGLPVLHCAPWTPRLGGSSRVTLPPPPYPAVLSSRNSPRTPEYLETEPSSTRLSPGLRAGLPMQTHPPQRPSLFGPGALAPPPCPTPVRRCHLRCHSRRSLLTREDALVLLLTFPTRPPLHLLVTIQQTAPSPPPHFIWCAWDLQ